MPLIRITIGNLFTETFDGLGDGTINFKNGWRINSSVPEQHDAGTWTVMAGGTGKIVKCESAGGYDRIHNETVLTRDFVASVRVRMPDVSKWFGMRWGLQPGETLTDLSILITSGSSTDGIYWANGGQPFPLVGCNPAGTLVSNAWYWLTVRYWIGNDNSRHLYSTLEDDAHTSLTVLYDSTLEEGPITPGWVGLEVWGAQAEYDQFRVSTQDPLRVEGLIGTQAVRLFDSVGNPMVSSMAQIDGHVDLDLIAAGFIGPQSGFLQVYQDATWTLPTTSSRYPPTGIASGISQGDVYTMVEGDRYKVQVKWVSELDWGQPHADLLQNQIEEIEVERFLMMPDLARDKMNVTFWGRDLVVIPGYLGGPLGEHVVGGRPIRFWTDYGGVATAVFCGFINEYSPDFDGPPYRMTLVCQSAFDQLWDEKMRLPLMAGAVYNSTDATTIANSPLTKLFDVAELPANCRDIEPGIYGTLPEEYGNQERTFGDWLREMLHLGGLMASVHPVVSGGADPDYRIIVEPLNKRLSSVADYNFDNASPAGDMLNPTTHYTDNAQTVCRIVETSETTSEDPKEIMGFVDRFDFEFTDGAIETFHVTGFGTGGGPKMEVMVTQVVLGNETVNGVVTQFAEQIIISEPETGLYSYNFAAQPATAKPAGTEPWFNVQAVGKNSITYAFHNPSPDGMRRRVFNQGIIVWGKKITNRREEVCDEINPLDLPPDPNASQEALHPGYSFEWPRSPHPAHLGVTMAVQRLGLRFDLNINRLRMVDRPHTLTGISRSIRSVSSQGVGTVDEVTYHFEKLAGTTVTGSELFFAWDVGSSGWDQGAWKVGP